MAERAAWMSAVPGRFDALLTQLAQQHGGVESLLDSFFDFLHRKTDFYAVSSDPAQHKMGFLPGQAERKVLAAFRKYPLRSLEGGDGAANAASHETQTQTQSATTAATVTTGAKHKPVKTEEPKHKPQLTEDGKQGMNEASMNSVETVVMRSVADAVAAAAGDVVAVPVGNGGVAANYTWAQTLEDVSIQMELPQGTRAKDLNCRIESTRLRVAMKSDPGNPLLEGELPEKIRADESIWSLESNHTLNISLEKIKPTWWATALKGGPEIDTSQVDSRRNIHEYDEATQGAIRKAVYDQRQQQLHGAMPLTPEEKMMQEAKDLPVSPFLPPVQQT